MKALIFNFRKKRFEVEKMPNPKIKKDYVLIEVKKSSLCATDLHIINGPLKSKVYNKRKIILGHSFSGTIKEKSDSVKKFKINDRVFGSNFVWCSECNACKSNKENLCDNRYIFGMETPGAHSELLLVPEKSLFHLPLKLDFETGSLICDLIGLAINSYKKAMPLKNNDIAIFGFGPVGMTIAILLISYGFKKIVVVEPNQYRQKLGKKILKDKIKIVNSIEHKNKFLNIADVIFETSGSRDALKKSFFSLKRGGKLILVGVHTENFLIDTVKWISRELSLMGVFNFKKEDIDDGLKLLLKEKVNLRKIITHSFNLEDGEKAYNLVESRNCGRIIFSVNKDN